MSLSSIIAEDDGEIETPMHSRFTGIAWYKFEIAFSDTFGVPRLVCGDCSFVPGCPTRIITQKLY